LNETQKRALIVGGGTGIGYAAAERLASRGVALALGGRRKSVLEEAAEKLSGGHPVRVEIVPGDAGVDEDARRMVDEAVAAFGGLDICVNCAGIYEPVDFLELDASSWRRTLSTTLDALAYVSAAAARAMAAAGRGGRFVLLSSINSPLSEPESAHYSAAKAGVSSLARSMAVDLAKYGIITNAVAPGWVHTAMVDDFVQEASPESLSRINVLGRVGQPGEIASVIEFLALDAPPYLLGATIFVDGGQTAMAPLI
jgi:3-oxoacyl-[acyl-carrier protein] reductase